MADLGIAAAASEAAEEHQPPVSNWLCIRAATGSPAGFAPLGAAVLADLELVTSTISLPAQASLFTQGEDARCLYMICSGYLKLTAGRAQDRQMIVPVAVPAPCWGCTGPLPRRLRSFSRIADIRAASPHRARTLPYLPPQSLRSPDACGSVRIQEYRFALQDACRISLAETVTRTPRPFCLSDSPTKSVSILTVEYRPATPHPRRDGVDGLLRAKRSHAPLVSSARKAPSPSKTR